MNSNQTKEPDNDLMRAAEAAALVGVSRDCWHNWTVLEKNPKPIRIGQGFVRWSRAEVLAWIEAKCPPRREWAAIWEARRKAKRRDERTIAP